MNRLRLIICIAVLALAGCGPAPPPVPTPTPVPPTPTYTPALVAPGTATIPFTSTTIPSPVPPTATAVPSTPTPTPSPPGPTPIPPTATVDPTPARRYPDVIIADFEASPRTWVPKMAFLKDVGINTIIIRLAYLRDPGEEYELVYPLPLDGRASEEYVRQLVATAREQGFAVMLGPTVGRLGDPHVPIEQIDDWSRFKADSIEIVLRWAAIAEDLHVEYFMPFCELNYLLSVQDSSRPGQPKYAFDEIMALLAEWDSEALPQIRAVFSGKLINQIYGRVLEYPVKGYDIVGMTYYASQPGVEGVTTDFRAFLDDAQTLARREGIDWMVVETEVVRLEAYDPSAPFEPPEWISRADAGPLDLEAELWKLAIQEYLSATDPPPAGFGTSLDSTAEGSRSVQGTPSEEVLRGFFAALKEMR